MSDEEYERHLENLLYWRTVQFNDTAERFGIPEHLPVPYHRVMNPRPSAA